MSSDFRLHLPYIIFIIIRSQNASCISRIIFITIRIIHRRHDTVVHSFNESD